MKIIFFGTPEFSAPFLRALILDSQIEVVGVVTQPDKPAGRGGQVQPSAVKVTAQDNLIPVFQPASLKKDKHIKNILQELEADFFVVVAYGKIIPKKILDISTRGCINVHPSLLPRHRGPSPMQWAIAQGDAATGISIMLLDEGMDTGPILATEHIDLDADETYSSLVAKVHQHGPQLLADTLKRFFAGEITPVHQDDSFATLTRLLEKEDGHVDWSQTMSQIQRKHRAYSVWPGTWVFWERSRGERLRLNLYSLRPSDFSADLDQGTVLVKNGRLFVDCQDGTLEILELKPEGKAKMTARAFIQGYPDIDGALMR
jgi:methionyl-tRNA formyltransferase